MEKNEERNYVVYMHTSPSGKRYVGLTKQSVEERWKNGWGYYTQLIFYRAILKYSFENFKHEIIASELSKEEAIDLEKELIKNIKRLIEDMGIILPKAEKQCRQTVIGQVAIILKNLKGKYRKRTKVDQDQMLLKEIKEIIIKV